MIEIRTGQALAILSRNAFHERFMQSFLDPAFLPEGEALNRIEDIAWDPYKEGRKAHVTRKAGADYTDTDYDLSVEWLETRDKLQKRKRHEPIRTQHHGCCWSATHRAMMAAAMGKFPKPGA